MIGRSCWLFRASAILLLFLILKADAYGQSSYGRGYPYVSSGRLGRPRPLSKDKVAFLSSVLKKHIAALRQTINKQVELVFLIDNSGSVGAHNFFNEIRFVRKLLADFTVDKHTTRVSIITFSSQNNVISQVDYLSNPSPDKNKCSLLEEDLPKIKYSGGGTYTLGAILMARDMFKAARPDAAKAIILITDGFSNGGDPRPQAKILRDRGVKIFTFGIKNGNVRELQDMASDPKNETCYILDSFEEFEALARRALHEDLHGGNYIPQNSKKCNKLCADRRDCCDEKAICTCGTHTGKYECMCKPGYYGHGLKGGCKACPAGTFKNESSPGDSNTCVPCPDENHMTKQGTTTVDQCTCKKGYQKFANQRCASLNCSVLKPPENGYFVNHHCNNAFNAACGTRCKPGYELKGKSVIICQDDGSWSGTDTQCIMKTCPALRTPKNGNRICSRGDFTYSTVCRFTCDKGYKLVGSRKRTCLAIAYWAGITTRCREITCQPLSELRNGKVLPEVCTGGEEVSFGTTCNMNCNSGFTLVGSHTKQCTPDGVWHPADDGEANQCVDTTPPLIICPNKIEVEADQDDRTAEVTWDLPVAIDNSGFTPLLKAIPAVKPQTRFPIGESEVVYVAEDLNENKIKCKFYVIVKDSQPPRVDRCVSPKTIITRSPQANVSWDEPLFSDNSNEPLHIMKSHQPGMFHRGTTSVTYTAYDGAGNTNNCTFKIKVIEHDCMIPPAPINGYKNCEESDNAIHCKLICMTGYAFAIAPPTEYFCSFDDSVWKPRESMPFPDCSVQEVSNEVMQLASVTFMGELPCKKGQLLNHIEANFEQRVTQLVNNLCAENLTCNVDDIETTCEEGNNFNKIKVVLEQKKRVLARKKRSRTQYRRPGVTGRKASESLITFDFMLEGSTPTSGVKTEDDKRQNALMENLENILHTLKKEAENGLFNLDIAGNAMAFANMTYAPEHPKFMCKPGKILINKSCVNCPIGTFFNVISEQCESCGKGTYQPTEGMVTCMVCPDKTSTTSGNSKTVEECKSQCLPGTISKSGLEFCETCEIGFYQTNYAQTKCIKCPGKRTTVRRGSRRVGDCQEKCAPGYVSKTGLEQCFPCPIGTFQPDTGKTSCYLCPHNAPTDSVASTHISNCTGDWELQRDDFQVQTPQLKVDSCFNNPCKNNGTCTAKKVAFQCACPMGYGGTLCGILIDNCKGNPCLNNGTCINKLGDYICNCPSGFIGKKCDTNIDECASFPCINSGTCVDLVNNYRCICPNGYRGTTCNENIDECMTNPCRNDGQCIDLIGRYKCLCSSGFLGENCEIDQDECASGPCLNNATCHDEADSFRCQCVSGFAGTACEIEIDECISSPCLHSGTCQDKINGYLCQCRPTYTGTNCELDADTNFMLQFDSPGILDYASIKLQYPLQEFTISFWMKTTDSENYGTVFSYATPAVANSILLTDYSGFVLYVNGSDVVTDVTANDGKWHHICVVWSNINGTWKIYKDGELMDQAGNTTVLAKGVTVPANGLLVIGQDQDKVGGDFNLRESFIGTIAYLNLWNKVLSMSVIKDMIKSCDHFGNIIAWPSVQSNLRGSLKKLPANFCQGCSKLPQPLYGEVQSTDTTIGSISVYSCPIGFFLEGKNQRQCLANNHWEGNSPLCKRVNCGRPNPLFHGYYKGSYFTFDSRVRYQCDKGYKLVGPKTRYCTDKGVWDKASPHCVEVICTIPSLSQNTMITSKREKYFPGNVVTFHCKSKADLISAHNSITCQSNGMWDKSIPTCDPNFCPQPPSIENGKVEKKKFQYLVGQNVEYKCHYGYKLSQTARKPTGILQCLPKGVWETNLPVCKIIDCGYPPNVSHAEFTNKGTTILETVEYKCHDGYVSTQNLLLECLEEGNWIPGPPLCQPVSCGQPIKINNTEIHATNYTFQGILTYTCRVGYILARPFQKICQSNGTWSNGSPVCNPVFCSSPELINHGRIIGSNYMFGKSIQYACEKGYTISGSSERFCLSNGIWENDSPVCIPISCFTPRLLRHGNYRGSDYHYNSTIQYFCAIGYQLIGESILKCTSNGSWEPGLPTCQPIMCPVPKDLYKGFLKITSLTFNSSVEYKCYPGYILEGDTIQVCQANKVWSGTYPKCIPLRCNKPLPLLNGSIKYSNLQVGSLVKFQCDKGFYLVGDKLITCLKNGKWGGLVPHCSPVICPELEDIVNGNKNDSSRAFGSVVSYECNTGYILQGNRSQTCTENRTWSGETPICQPFYCNTPPNVIPNGRMIGRNFSIGATTSYVCDAGYATKDERNRTCQPDRHWDNPVPICEKVICPQLRVRHGKLSTFQHKFGDVVRISCIKGYVLVGLDELICLANGSWSGAVSLCAESCPQPPSLANARVDGVFAVGFTATYTCNSGYRLVGNASTKCLSGRVWSGLILTCKPQHCRPPPDLKNGVKRILSNKPGGIVGYQCYSDFELKGDSKLICSNDSIWLGNYPQCIKSSCPPPAVIDNGQVNYTALTSGNWLTYRCNKGYKLIGLARRLCLRTKKWSSTKSRCQKIRCGKLTLPHGKILGTSFQFGDTVMQICEGKYYLEGTINRTCQADGHWSGNSSCVLRECSKAPTFPNGFPYPVDDSLPFSKFFPVNTVMKLWCDEKYEGVGNATQVCLPNGTWSITNFKCEIIRCPEVSLNFTNGFLNGSMNIVDTLLYFNCNTGYQLDGDRTLQCMLSGHWNSSIPVCLPVSCPSPEKPQNGLVHGKKFYFGQVITYSCEEGFEFTGKKSRTCLSDGTWSGSDFHCLPVMCPLPLAIYNGEITVTNYTYSRYSFGSQIFYQCLEGFQLVGQAQRQCLKNRTWSGVSPSCIAVLCPAPHIRNGHALEKLVSYGGSITYKCNIGFRLVPSKVTQLCAANGSLVGKKPTCRIVSCPIKNLRNGQRIGESFTYNSIISFKCLPGYTINRSNRNLLCLSSGSWNGSFPVCNLIHCPVPKFKNGKANSTLIPYRDAVSYSCNEGYIIVGSVTSWCTASGKLTNPPPTCLLVTCRRPPKITNAVVTGNIFKYKSMVHYKCKDGYDLVGNNLLKCGSDSKWHGELPHCEPVMCEPPPVIPYATVLTTHTSLDGQVTFICNSGFLLKGKATAECTANKTWVYDSNVECLPLNCGQPHNITNGKVMIQNTTYGSFVKYTCNNDYKLEGPSQVMCQTDGSWGQIPSCVLADCGPPLTNEHVNFSGDNFSAGHFVIYTCPDGYNKKGPFISFCLPEGNWSNPSPTCEAISCEPFPAPPDNGIILVSNGNLFMASVKYSCNYGLIMEGDGVLVCQADGKWNGTAPICSPAPDIREHCDELPYTIGSLDRTTKYIPGDSVTMACPQGFQPEGTRTVTCMANGTWTKLSGHCRKVECGRPILHGRVNLKILGNSFFFGDKVFFFCRTGLIPVRSPALLTCQANGTWDGEAACLAQCKFTCQNGGRCIGFNRCKCRSGYAGRRCEKPLCILPCLNGGKCAAPYRCSCVGGFIGSRCEKAGCSKPCKNGGKCIAPNRCHCKNGFKPPFCEPHKLSVPAILPR